MPILIFERKGLGFEQVCVGNLSLKIYVRIPEYVEGVEPPLHWQEESFSTQEDVSGAGNPVKVVKANNGAALKLSINGELCRAL